MSSFSGMHKGDLRVDDYMHLTGTVTGDLTVGDGGSVDLSGTVSGRLIVLAGGEADVRGVVMGAAEPLGRITVAIGAKINGRVMEDDGNWSRTARHQEYFIDDSTPRFALAIDGSVSPA